MKIERINDNQIRCTLTSKDLASRKIKVSELAYGSRKARSLFEEMMHQAETEVGFTSDDLPLMIEAVPINADCIVFVITRVEDPEELDTRFSKFVPRVCGDDEDEDEEEEETAETSNSFDDFLKRALGAEEVKTPETINAAYRFSTIRDVVNVANYMGGSAFIPNLLYKDLANDGYILYLPSLEEGDPKEVARFCGLLSEFAAPDLSLKQIPAHAAGFECIIPENALAHLAEV